MIVSSIVITTLNTGLPRTMLNKELCIIELIFLSIDINFSPIPQNIYYFTNLCLWILFDINELEQKKLTSVPHIALLLLLS